jgi:hypothetical protein
MTIPSVFDVQLPINAKSMFWSNRKDFHAGKYQLYKMESVKITNEKIIELFGESMELGDKTSYEWDGWFLIEEESGGEKYTVRVPVALWNYEHALEISLWVGDRKYLNTIVNIMKEY